MWRWVVVLLCCVGGTQEILAGEGHHSVTPNVGTVGSHFTYTLHMEYSEAYQLVQVPTRGSLKPFEVIDRRIQKTKESGVRSLDLVFDLRIFEVGAHQIPTQSIVLRHQGKNLVYQLPSLSVLVQSVLDTQDPSKLALMDAVSPSSLKVDWSLYIWPVILGVLGLVGFVFGVRSLLKRRKQLVKSEKKEPSISPFDKAFSTLEVLSAGTYLTYEDCRRFCDQLSEVLKRLIEDVYQQPVLEMTTTEVMAFLPRFVDDQTLKRISKVLEYTDLVKFAQFQFGESDYTDMISKVRDVVERLQRMSRVEAQNLVSEGGQP